MRRFWGVIVHSFQGTIVGVFQISVVEMGQDPQLWVTQDVYL